MNDKEFAQLQLRATIVPQQARWPAAEFLHWQQLHALANEARDRVAKFYQQADEIDRDVNLSRGGKEKQHKKAATEAIAVFEQSKSLTRARQSVADVMAQWEQRVTKVVRRASDAHEAAIYSKVWNTVDALRGTSRMAWLEKNAGDPIIASAILTAPAALCGLSEAELSLVKRKVEVHALGAEIAEARAATLKAMKEAEQGWQKAINKVGERAGLTKGADGTWRDASMSEAA